LTIGVWARTGTAVVVTELTFLALLRKGIGHVPRVPGLIGVPDTVPKVNLVGRNEIKKKG